MSTRLKLRATPLVVAVLVTGCAVSGVQPSATPSQQTQASVPSSSTSGSTSPAGKPLNTGCDPPSPPCALSAGTWVLSGRHSFILGMQFTVPDGWKSTEQDAGEFALVPIDHPEDHIFMVKDIAAVTTDGTAKIVPGIPQTVDGLTAYWRGDPNLVVSPSEPAQIAGGIDAISYVISISPDAKFADAGCPAYPRCADFFTDPRYWDGGVYGIGAPEETRLYLATIQSGTDSHLFVIGLEGADHAALERLTEEAGPIIDSIRLPSEFPIW